MPAEALYFCKIRGSGAGDDGGECKGRETGGALSLQDCIMKNKNKNIYLIHTMAANIVFEPSQYQMCSDC